MNHDDILKQTVEDLPPTTDLLDYNVRKIAANRLAAQINQFNFDTKIDSWLHDIESDGIVSLGVCLDRSQVGSIHEYFKDKDVYNGHVIADSDGVNRKLQEGYDFKYACYDINSVINAPHILDIALREDIVSLVSKYLGCTPTIFSMNCWWTLPSPRPSGIEKFHRDWDDYKFLAVFIYLTDVDENSGGAHCFIRKFHNPEVCPLVNTFNQFNSVEWYQNNCPELVTDFHASAGSIFCADTFSLHKGSPCIKPRLALWIRYGYFANKVFQDDKGRECSLFQATEKERLSKLSTFKQLTDKQKYMLRLLVDHD